MIRMAGSVDWIAVLKNVSLVAGAVSEVLSGTTQKQPRQLPGNDKGKR